jgi:hypothetical protein
VHYFCSYFGQYLKDKWRQKNMKLDAKDLLLTIVISFGLLWVLDALGVGAAILGWIGDKIPFGSSLGNVPSFTLGTYTIAVQPVAALIATILLSGIVTFVALSMQEGFQNKKFWGTFAILAIISAVIWVVVPQIVPLKFGQIFGSAQALFVGHVPMSVLG